MPTAPTQPFGITLPLSRGAQGYFNQSFSLLDQVKTNLQMLLQTKKGERRMSPEFGSGLWSILFENSTDSIDDIIESTIRRDISAWMGYVNIDNISIQQSSTDPYKIDVSLKFTVPSAGITTPQDLQVSMDGNPTA